ncbi:MAG: ribosome recycling factor [Limisphaerales bacterium]
MSIDEILLETEEKMLKAEEHLSTEFNGVRTGKASPGLVENISAEVYGAHMRLRDLATISCPEARQILIQPWDAGSLGPIEKAIQASKLGLSPAVHGKLIRISIPELSTEQRERFVKALREMAEKGRVALRHLRREALEALKKEAKAGGVTEDQIEVAEKDVQKLTDQYVNKVDAHLAHKEKEIMTV